MRLTVAFLLCDLTSESATLGSKQAIDEAKDQTCRRRRSVEEWHQMAKDSSGVVLSILPMTQFKYHENDRLHFNGWVNGQLLPKYFSVNSLHSNDDDDTTHDSAIGVAMEASVATISTHYFE